MDEMKKLVDMLVKKNNASTSYIGNDISIYFKREEKYKHNNNVLFIAASYPKTEEEIGFFCFTGPKQLDDISYNMDISYAYNSLDWELSERFNVEKSLAWYVKKEYRGQRIGHFLVTLGIMIAENYQRNNNHLFMIQSLSEMSLSSLKKYPGFEIIRNKTEKGISYESVFRIGKTPLPIFDIILTS
jgi:hypothetical protein